MALTLHPNQLNKLRKGQVELPFHMIFALVAGSVILLIFIIFAFKGWNISQSTASIDTANTLMLLLTSTEVSSKTFIPIDNLQKAKLDFGCEGFSVNGQEKIYRNKIVFAPSSTTTTRLFLWSFDWNVPFYVTNMLAITSPSVLYVFVGTKDDPTFKFLQNTIPKNITTIYIQPSALSTFTPTGHEQTRFIFVNIAPQFPQAFSGKKITGLKIDEANKKLTFLNLRFPPSEDLAVIGDAMLLGAIFSDNAETYKCNVDKAYERLKYLAQIYNEKQKFLQSNVPPDRFCTYNVLLSGIISDPKSLTLDLVDNIRKANKLLQQQSCPLIY